MSGREWYRRPGTMEPERLFDRCPDCNASACAVVYDERQNTMSAIVDHEPSCPWFTMTYGNRADRRRNRKGKR